MGLRVGLAALALAAVPPLASAHGSLSIEDDKCKLRLGPYAMHFSGYQPEATAAREFCEDIPATGRTVVVLDAIDSRLREVPIEVRVIADPGDPAAEARAPALLHVAPKVYETGSLSFEHEFGAPGKFVGLVTAGDKGQYVARFPFSVGVKSADRSGLMWILAIAASAAVLWYFARWARRRDVTRAQRAVAGNGRNES